MSDYVLHLSSSCRNFLPLLTSALPLDALQNETAKKVFKFASYLTQPICDMHKNLRLVWAIEPLNPNAYRLANYGRKSFQYLKVGALGLLGAIPAVFGIALRALGSKIQKDPWICLPGKAPLQTAFRTR